MDSLKRCQHCKLYKETILFSKNRSKKDGLCSYCKECSKKHNKETYARYAEKNRAYSKEYRKIHKYPPDQKRKHKLKGFYKMTIEDFDKKLSEQSGTCAICKSTQPYSTHKKETIDRLCVDHDRVCCPTNKSCGKCVRGLLCHTCNTAIGMFKDNLNILGTDGAAGRYILYWRNIIWIDYEKRIKA